MTVTNASSTARSPSEAAAASGARRRAWRVLLSGLVLYALGFVAFYPSLLSVNDEVAYVRQALAFASGRATVIETDPLTSEEKRVAPSRYPVGTSALQAPFVLLGGWRSAAVASLASLILAVWLTGKWLQDGGRSPLFALLVLGYPPALVMGRVAMSDVPSAAVVALSLWLFWRGQGRSRALWFASGLTAGGSILFRETNVLLPGAFIAGALLRRERGALALVAGGMAGLALHLAASSLVFGSPFFVRDPGHGLALAAIPRNAPLYLFALLVMIPGGLLAGLLYRGPRRPEVVAGVVAVAMLYAAYDYGGELTGGLKRLVVGPRYFIPLSPLLAWAMAEVVPRTWTALSARRSAASPSWLWRVRRPLVGAWAACVLVGAALVHPVMDAWGRSQIAVARALLDHTREGAAVVTNSIATSRFLTPVHARRVLVPHHRILPDDVARLLRSHGSVQLAFLERFDHEVPGRWFHETGPFVEEVRARCRLDPVYDGVHGAVGRVRIWNVTACPSAGR